MKKCAINIIAVLLCTLVVCGLGTAVFAAGAPGINGAAEDQAVAVAPGVGDEDDFDGNQGKTQVYVQVYEGVKIIGQTEDFAMPVGGSQMLQVAVRGIGPFSYQWYDTNGTPVGTNSREYPIVNAVEGLHRYRVVVTDAWGRTDETTIEVLVNNEYAYRSITKGDFSAGAYMHNRTDVNVTGLPEGSPAYTALQNELAAVAPGHVPIWAGNAQFTSRGGGAAPTPLYIGDVAVKVEVGSQYNGQTLVLLYTPEGGGPVQRYEVEVVNGVVLKEGLPAGGSFMVGAPSDTTYTINVVAPSVGGSIAPGPGAVNVPTGQNKTFVFWPETGYVLDEVLVDGVPVPFNGNSYTFTGVPQGATHTLTARFRAVPPQDVMHTLTVTSGSGGTASPSGSLQVRHGGRQTVYFYPNNGYVVDTVLVNGQPMLGTNGSYTFTAMEADATLHVTFKRGTPLPEVRHTITATAGPGGRISPAGAVQVPYGGGMEFYFVPDSGYVVDKVYVNGALVATQGSYYYFSNLIHNATIHVVFKRAGGPGPGPGEYYTIETETDGHGSVNPAGPVSVPRHGSQTFYFVPNAGYRVNAVYLDGVQVAGRTGQYACVDVTQNHLLRVTFGRVPPGPITGDEIGTLVLWGLLAMAVAALFIVLILLAKRKEKHGEDTPRR